MIPAWLIKIGISIAVDTVKSYVNNTDSKLDDKVLDLTKVGANYLAKKGNNTVTNQLAEELNKSDMRNDFNSLYSKG